MSLTGPVTTWGTVLVTVAVIALVVRRWRVLGGKDDGIGPVLARLATVVTVNVLVLLTAAVQLNDQFLFFADWGDLVGALGGPQQQVRLAGGGSAGAAVAKPAAGAVAAGEVLLPLPAGESQGPGATGYTVTGPLSGLTGQVVISLPPGYGTDPARRYPVLETFSGYPGSVSQWVRTMRIRGVLDGEAAARRLGPVVVVSSRTEFPAGADSECVNGAPGRPQVETWLTRDVPAWVVQHLRVRTDRASWATIGLSAGGWCAAMAAMLHPGQYGAGIVLGGYFRPDFSASDVPFPAGAPPARRYDLVALAHRAPPPVALWVETSHADPLSYRTSAALLKQARRPLSVSATVLPDAGHRMSVWQGLLPTALAWLGATAPGFAPGPAAAG